MPYDIRILFDSRSNDSTIQHVHSRILYIEPYIIFTHQKRNSNPTSYCFILSCGLRSKGLRNASTSQKKLLQLKGLVPGPPIECWAVVVLAIGMPDLNCPAVVILAARLRALL